MSGEVRRPVKGAGDRGPRESVGGTGGRVIVVAGGRVQDPRRLRERVDPRPHDRVLAADAGFAHARALGLRPELILGDLDSLPAVHWAEVERLGIAVRRVPREKDETDTELALRVALEWAPAEIVLVAGVGSRLDHSLANLFLLASLPAGIKATLLDERNRVHFLRDGESIELPARSGVFLSLVPLTPEVTGVFVDGVHWPLADACLTWRASLGVSNEFRSETARIRVGRGRLAVIEAED